MAAIRLRNVENRSVENGAAFSTWKSAAKGALTPALSPRERGLSERGVVSRSRGPSWPLRACRLG